MRRKTLLCLCLGILLAISCAVRPARAQSPSTETTTRIFSTYVNRGVNSATIEWKTDPETKGRIEYANETGVWQATPWQEDYTQSHTITLLSLKPDTSYLYRINAESHDGQVKTERSSFNTLSADILGGQQPYNLSNDTSSFQSILSPSPPAFATTPGYTYPSVLGQQNYLPIPYVQNIYPVTNTQPTVTQPTFTPSPSEGPTATPTIAPSALGLLASNSTNLILGVLIGVSLALLIHQVAVRGNTGQTKAVTSGSANEGTNKFRFNVGNEK